MDELIRKQDAIKAICEDGTWLERQGCTEITMAERKQRDVDIIESLPTVQPELYKDEVNRQAVKHLDLFTKVYCRDESVTNDLVFRCKQCDFEMPDGKCLVKIMARKLCHNYKNFGSMGDL